MVRTARRRGAHRRPRQGSRARTVGAVLFAVAAASGISVLALSAGSGETAAPQAVPVQPQAAPAGSAAAITDCARAVALGRDVIAAAQPSYSHWAGHVRAQIDFNTGAADLEQTRARWAATKATADADIAQFSTALAAFEPVRDGCAQGRSLASPASASTAVNPVLVACRSEFDAVSTAVAAAGAVVHDWSHHIEMMKDKEHIDPAQYGQQWREMVQAAPANLDRFARASLELTNHADCPDPR